MYIKYKYKKFLSKLKKKCYSKKVETLNKNHVRICAPADGLNRVTLYFNTLENNEKQ